MGATSHFVAVPADRAEQPVREFEAFTADLYRLADWLTECGVETVVMESTGVYWIPLFGVLEERGFQVMLVDPRRIKNVPGRKTDVLDCQWLQQLHTYGLLSGAFRPDKVSLNGNLPAKSWQFGTCRPAKLDKIKNLRVEGRFGKVIRRLPSPVRWEIALGKTKIPQNSHFGWIRFRRAGHPRILMILDSPDSNNCFRRNS